VRSAIYSGWVKHRRRGPVPHKFHYRLFMLYLDLAELPKVFDRFWFWSARSPALACFRRSDYLRDPDGDENLCLDATVRKLVLLRTGRNARGPIRLLTHLRYFGHCFNPVSFYYCFDERAEHVEFIVAEITNTPWKERHAYVLPIEPTQSDAPAWNFDFGKSFHVSPFMPMDVSYRWNFSDPGERLLVHMQNFREQCQMFEATLALERQPISSCSLAAALVRFPLMTMKVVAAIHWQALRLWLKRVPVFTHPAKLDS
jgi:DUF1365 family protein